MISFVFIASFCVSGVFTILTLQVRKPGDRFIVLLLYYLLLCLAGCIIVSQLLGVVWHPYLEIAAFVFIAVYWMRQIWVSSFWGKLLNETWLILHLFIGGYLYATTQIPYTDKPFASISMNAPLPLNINQYNIRQISGLPTVKQQVATNIEPHEHEIKKLTTPFKQNDAIALSWENIEPLMQKDSHIRVVMHQSEKIF